MKAIVIRSNHGNHQGFSRKWEVLDNGRAFDNEQQACEYLAEVANELEEDEPGELPHKELDSYEYDLRYYYVVTEEDYNNGFFDGRHHGYASRTIKEIFNDVE